MKQRNIRLLAALAALALSLSAGCSGDKTAQPQPPAPSKAEQAPAQSEPAKTPEPEPAPENKPEETPEEPAKPERQTEEAPEEPAPAQTPDPAPQPKPEQKPAEPQPPAAPSEEAPPEDGNYTADVTLAGGTGRASVQSPAQLRCAGGQFVAVVVWSSPNFDYMKVDGVRYDPVSAPGSNSAFEIPVAAFDQPLTVLADTVAMSEPHEVEYALTFRSDTLTKQ